MKNKTQKTEQKSKNTEQKSKNTVHMITREEFEEQRKRGLEILKDPEIRAVFMRLKDK